MLIQKERFPIKEILVFGFLPNFIKKLIYRIKGYRIGKKVSFGFGSVVCGEKVRIGDYSSIGFFTIIRGKEIKIGSHVHIGATSILDTPFLEIGDGSKINEQVFAGGLQCPDSRLVIGRNCQIMQMSFINPAKSIVIGDDSGIGGHCLLFGHYSWLSQFEGYPVEFSPIEIGRSVSLNWRVFVLPGTKIGDGAVIGADSLVHRTIPEKCLAVGFPARVVSRYPDFPREVSEKEKPEMLRNIVNEMITFFSDSGLDCRELNEDSYEIIHKKRRLGGTKTTKWIVTVRYGDVSKNEFLINDKKPDVLISLKEIPREVREMCNSRMIMWIDIEKKEQPLFWNDLGEEVTLFLKRYGVRLFRVQV
jgi:acetyltransferase-like isoleucine patch superfamily enzyme